MELEILGAAAESGKDGILYFLNFTNAEDERYLVAEFLRDVGYTGGIAPDSIRAVALESTDNLETTRCVALCCQEEETYRIISDTEYRDMMKHYFMQIL